MSSFIENIKNELNSTKTTTENGAVAYETTGKALLDINFAISTLRNATTNEIEDKFSKAFFENPTLAVVWLFFARDVRGGVGERRLFRVCLNWLANNKPDIVKMIVSLIPEYGRWDDMFELAESSNGDISKCVMDIICDQFIEDAEAIGNGKQNISLLAKWMPSINTSSPKTCALGKKFARFLGMSDAQYRKTLSKLRKHLDVVEVKASANEWNAIKYEAVPSKANIKYKAAFVKHDAARRQEFLNKLEKGEVKINSAASFPCDIVHSYFGHHGYWDFTIETYDEALEGMWKNLPDYVKDVDNKNTIVVCDGSGSMSSRIGDSNMNALEVAWSLSIYFAERMSESPFKDKFITFSTRPRLVDMSNAKTLHDRLEIIHRYNECSNTNLEATMDLILNTAIKNKTPQKDIPNILILSDMNFDSMVDCGRNGAKTLMENIEAKWNKAGYRLPRITYWNIIGGCGRQAPVPVQKSEAGIALVSGFSPAIASMVYSSKTDPYEVLVEKLESPRYASVFKALN